MLLKVEKVRNAGMVESIRSGNLMTDVIPKLSVDMGCSLPGGSPTKCSYLQIFRGHIQCPLPTFGTASGLIPSPDAASLRSDASREISQPPEQFIAEEDGSITVLPMNTGGQQSEGPQHTSIPDGKVQRFHFWFRLIKGISILCTQELYAISLTHNG